MLKYLQMKKTVWVYISLDKVQELDSSQSAIVHVKVVSVGDVIDLGDLGNVQNVVIADQTGGLKIALWEEFVN